MIANPPPWPNGARCAVAVTFDVDSDSILHLNYPREAHRRLNAQSWLRYDQVAVPRIVAMYRELGLRQTFFMPGWCIERYPEIAAAIVDGDQELAIHGYLHELAHEIAPELEEELLGRIIAASEHASGVRPLGWRAPLYSFSSSSPELLAAAGLLYDSSLMGDDVPYVLDSPGGRLVELPIDTSADDWAQYAHSYDFDFLLPIHSPERAAEVFQAEIDAALEYGGMWIGVFHPFVSGRPSRLTRVRTLLEQLLSRGDVWVASLGEIAEHVVELERSGAWTPRHETVPYYTEPIPELSVIEPKKPAGN
ncbi:MAG TPA: polysaccharide deacetylase family protein [Solirubrobacteraceae bacterium]|nr:polysaccharide deacetylase family protein [Solirubrobacteraceae bacterium]